MNPDPAMPGTKHTRRQLLTAFRCLKDAITIMNYSFDGLHSDVGWEGMALYGVADNANFSTVLRLALGTTSPNVELTDWPEDLPWVELWLYFHQDGRLTRFRTENGETFNIAFAVDERERFAAELDPWMAQVLTESTAWQQILAEPNNPITFAQLSEMMITYLKHYSQPTDD